MRFLRVPKNFKFVTQVNHVKMCLSVITKVTKILLVKGVSNFECCQKLGQKNSHVEERIE